jgi:hypothetical protein
MEKRSTNLAKRLEDENERERRLNYEEARRLEDANERERRLYYKNRKCYRCGELSGADGNSAVIYCVVCASTLMAKYNHGLCWTLHDFQVGGSFTPFDFLGG